MADTVNVGNGDGDGKERPPREEPRPRTRTRAAGKDKPPAPRRPTPKESKLAESLTGTYAMTGGLLIGVGMARDDTGIVATGNAMVTNAEVAAEAWLDVARANPKVMAALVKFSEGSAVAGLISVHLSMAFPFLADRGIVPAALAGNAAANTNGGNGSSN